MKKRVATVGKIVVATLIFVIGFIAVSIYRYGHTSTDVLADAAIVLGAAVWGEQV